MKTLLTTLLTLFIILSMVEAVVIYFCKSKECPELVHINKFIESDSTLKPIAVIPVINSKFDTLFDVPLSVHKKKPTLKQRVTGKHNYHKVKKGENLYRIGLLYKVPYKFLMEVNKFKTVDIESGQWIYLGNEDDRLAYVSRQAKKIEADSLYIYNKRYGDSLNYAMVYTEAFGPILTQSVDLHFSTLRTKQKRFGFGVAVSNSYYSPYEIQGGYFKNNTLFTGGVGLGKRTIVKIGVLKLIK